MQIASETQWKWVDCPMVIQKTNKNQNNQEIQVFECLKPILCFQDDTGNEEQLIATISLDKPLPYQEEPGFVWHKNCIIPQIRVTLDALQWEKLRSQFEDKQIFCQISSVITLRKTYYYLSKVPLQGDTNKAFGSNNYLKFNNLKFSQTSFNKNKSKFSLLVWIYVLNINGDRNTVKAFISSQIYVDSRKQARKKPSSKPDLSQKIDFDRFLEPIQIKSNNKQKNIENSIQGFMSFYGAANIRNKIKHPFYLAYHFNNIFTIYYNKLECKSAYDALKKISVDKKFNSKILMIVVRAECSMRKKILLLFENWRFHFVTVTLESDNIYADQKWVQIPFGAVIQNYQRFCKQQIFQPRVAKVAANKQKQSEDRKRQSIQHFQLHHQFQLQGGARKRVKQQCD